MEPVNGSYVTRAELKAHLDPMKSDITEIKGDVKTLVLAQAGQKAVSTLRMRFSTRALSWAALIVGALSPLAWTHHF